MLLYLLITYPDGLLEAQSPDSQDKKKKEREREREREKAFEKMICKTPVFLGSFVSFC